MSLIENLKNFFSKIDKQEKTAAAPEGICPNCWGRGEWEGEYYKFKKGEGGNPSKATYNSFVQDVARQLDKIMVEEDSFVCETCKIKGLESNH